MVFPNYTTVNWEENREFWIHGFQIHGKFLVPKNVDWEVTLYLVFYMTRVLSWNNNGSIFFKTWFSSFPYWTKLRRRVGGDKVIGRHTGMLQENPLVPHIFSTLYSHKSLTTAACFKTSPRSRLISIMNKNGPAAAETAQVEKSIWIFPMVLLYSSEKYGLLSWEIWIWISNYVKTYCMK